ncbi:MAG TPA: HAD family hydrolase [Gemmataceae bacterium]|jgi:HAD superfamily hydrolase (TIGR01509 family)|nr:HAD family hydrolase [Gemmataceae bacterium]
MPKIRGLLLDIDGTLVDSNDAHARAWEKAFAEAGMPIRFGQVRPLIGMGGDKLVPRVSGLDAESGLGKQISDRRGEIFLTEFAPGLRPCRGARELLDLLKARGLKLAVATSAKKKELGPLLKVCGADRVIDAKTSSDDADNSKPDPDIIQAALAEVGLSPGEVMLLGDTPYDVEAATRAGVRTIALRCGGWDDGALGGAAAIYDDPQDLADHLDESPLGR